MASRAWAVLALVGAAWVLASTAAAQPAVDKAARREAAAFTGKPLAPIGLSHAIDGPPRVGQPVEVTLTVTPQGALLNGTLTLRAAEGLIVTGLTLESEGRPVESIPVGNAANPAFSASLTDIDAEGVLVARVSIVPLTFDLLHLTVVVDGDIGGVRQTRSLTIPFRLGPRRRPDAPLTRDDSGQLIRPLPARRE